MSMNTTTIPLTVTPEASKFLEEHGLEAAFRSMCDLARQYFPETLRIEAAYEKDPEEPEVFQYVAVRVYIRKDIEVTRFSELKRTYFCGEAELFSSMATELIRIYPRRAREPR